MKRLFFVLLLACSTVTCSPPKTIQTAQGKTAYSADQVAVRVNELENTAIQANAGGGLPVQTTRTIVDFCVTADQTLAQTPSGWLASVTMLWQATKARLPPVSNPALVAAMSAVDVVLGVLAEPALPANPGAL